MYMYFISVSLSRLMTFAFMQWLILFSLPCPAKWLLYYWKIKSPRSKRIYKTADCQYHHRCVINVVNGHLVQWTNKYFYKSVLCIYNIRIAALYLLVWHASFSFIWKCTCVLYLLFNADCSSYIYYCYNPLSGKVRSVLLQICDLFYSDVPLFIYRGYNGELQVSDINFRSFVFCMSFKFEF